MCSFGSGPKEALPHPKPQEAEAGVTPPGGQQDREGPAACQGPTDPDTWPGLARGLCPGNTGQPSVAATSCDREETVSSVAGKDQGLQRDRHAQGPQGYCHQGLPASPTQAEQRKPTRSLSSPHTHTHCPLQDEEGTALLALHRGTVVVSTALQDEGTALLALPAKAHGQHCPLQDDEGMALLALHRGTWSALPPAGRGHGSCVSSSQGHVGSALPLEGTSEQAASIPWSDWAPVVGSALSWRSGARPAAVLVLASPSWTPWCLSLLLQGLLGGGLSLHQGFTRCLQAHQTSTLSPEPAGHLLILSLRGCSLLSKSIEVLSRNPLEFLCHR